MTSIRIAFTELQRILTGSMSRVAVLALVLIPSLYGGLYLFANHDPYGSFDRIPAALVVLDTGGTDAAGKVVNAGREVADQLVTEHSFDWHEVSAGNARDGVKDGRYDFALTIPADFSAALTSATRFAPERARLRMTTNDANSYLSTSIADAVTGKVRDALAQRVGSAAATQFLVGFGQIRGSLADAATGAAGLHTGAAQAAAGATRLRAGAARLSAGAGELSSGLNTLRSRSSALPGATDQLAAGALAVANGNAAVAQIGDNLVQFAISAQNAYFDHRLDLVNRMNALGLNAYQQNQLLAVYDSLQNPITDANQAVQSGAQQLDALSTGANRVAVGARRVANAMPALIAGIDQARSGAAGIGSGATRLSAASTRLGTGLGTLAGGTDTLARKLSQGVNSIPAVSDDQRDRLAATISDPVSITGSSQASAGSYGAGLAPFFMSLAVWIGGYVLFLLIRPLSRRAMAANQSPLRVALGGWLTPALVGIVQVSVLLAVVAAAIHIVPQNLAGTWLFLLLASATFVAIVHALNAWFGAAGQFLGLVLMVLQLVTAGGTFPWQTIPPALHPLHQVLPMGYAVDGLRQLMYGGLSTLVIRDVAVLAGWLVVALVASAYAARRQRIWTVSRVKPSLAL